MSNKSFLYHFLIYLSSLYIFIIFLYIFPYWRITVRVIKFSSSKIDQKRKNYNLIVFLLLTINLKSLQFPNVTKNSNKKFNQILQNKRFIGAQMAISVLPVLSLHALHQNSVVLWHKQTIHYTKPPPMLSSRFWGFFVQYAPQKHTLLIPCTKEEKM